MMETKLTDHSFRSLEGWIFIGTKKILDVLKFWIKSSN
jgi:hypothetical protein